MSGAARRPSWLEPAVAAVAGVTFGVGLVLAGMTTPRKVVGFLDVAGPWDPSLALVMAGAIGAHWAALRWLSRGGRPPLGAGPPAAIGRAVDGRLIGGAALFGVGWGLAGYCPGPAVVGAATAASAPLTFVAAMLAGMALFDRLLAPRLARRSG